jgi:hypothetical protein
LCSIGFSIVIFRIFFPLKSREIEEGKLTLTYSKSKLPRSLTENKMDLLSVRGRKQG